MPTVYVTQIPVHRDKETKAIVPAINISPACEYGDIETMFPSRVGLTDTSSIRRQVSQKLIPFDHQEDCILPLGDPVLSAITFAVVGALYPAFNVLKWDKKLKKYIKVRVGV